jgi:archaellum component FlaG (FlaF/FlaG flagellin family)
MAQQTPIYSTSKLKKSRKKTWIVTVVSVPPENNTAPVQLTVDKVILDKATPNIKNDKGHTYYIFNITIKNTGSDDIDVYPWYFYLVTSKGTMSNTHSFKETNPLNKVTLSPGQTATGQVAFAVQNGATLKAIYFEYESQKSYAPSIPSVTIPPPPVQLKVNNVIVDNTTPSIVNDTGHTYYIFNITIKNTGSDDIYVSQDDFYLVTSKGTESYTILSAKTNPLNAVTLSPGQTATGQVAFAVQNGATLKAIYFKYESQKFYAPRIPEPSGSV